MKLESVYGFDKEVIVTHSAFINAIKEKKRIKDDFKLTQATAEVWDKDKFLCGFVFKLTDSIRGVSFSVVR